MVPIKVHNNIWFGIYTKFNEPIVNIYLQINKSAYYDNPVNYLLTLISSIVLNRLISIIFFKPLEVGYSIYISFSSKTNSLNINISGLNDINKIKLLLNDLFIFINNIHKYLSLITLPYLTNLIKVIQGTLKDEIYLNSWNYSNVIINNIIYSTSYSTNVLLKHINHITYDQIIQYLLTICNDTIISSFIYGNLNHKNKNDLVDIIKRFGQSNKKIIYPTINSLYNITVKHPYIKEKSNCISYYYKIGKFKAIKYLLMHLFVNIFNELYFDYIRTKYQLGYLVRLSIIVYQDTYYIFQKIQSDNNLKYIIKLMNTFNKNILNYLEKIDLKSYINGLQNELLRPASSFAENLENNLIEIVYRTYLFNKNEYLLKYISELSLNKLKLFINKFINNDNKTVIIIKGHN
jgi:insulysin